MPAAIARAATATISFLCMRGAILAAFAALVIAWGGPAGAQLENITNREAVSALKTALEKGSRAAVEQLGRENGFFGDARVKKYFAGGNRIAMTFKMNAPPKETKADATDAKKKGATAAK